MDDVLIRPIEEKDLARVIGLLAADPLGATREDAADPPAACYVDALAAMAADGRTEFVVAERAGAVVGCLQLTFLPGLSRRGMERAQVESVRVAASARGTGLGRRLLDWSIARARQRGCGLVQLTTDKTRDQAQGFYEQLGFVASHIGMKLDL